jgi:hypothetical protein
MKTDDYKQSATDSATLKPVNPKKSCATKKLALDYKCHLMFLLNRWAGRQVSID